MGGPALFGRPSREPLILLEPLFNMRKSGITHRRLLPSLALIATFWRGRLLQQQFGNGITREPKVLGSCALAFALDQHPGANFVSKCHGIHLSFLRSLEISFEYSGLLGPVAHFCISEWLTLMIAF